jgi:hypothetical protein
LASTLSQSRGCAPTDNVLVSARSSDVGLWPIATFRCDAELGRYGGNADIEQAEPMSSRLARCKGRTLSARDIGIYGPLVAAEIARVWRLFRWPKFAFKPTGNLGGLEGIKPFALFASERARSHAAGSQSEAHQRPALGASYGSGGLLHSGNLEIPEAACPCQKIRLRYKIIPSRSGQGGTCVQFIT